MDEDADDGVQVYKVMVLGSHGVGKTLYHKLRVKFQFLNNG